jgi:hypothetical protein
MFSIDLINTPTSYLHLEIVISFKCLSAYPLILSGSSAADGKTAFLSKTGITRTSFMASAIATFLLSQSFSLERRKFPSSSFTSAQLGPIKTKTTLLCLIVFSIASAKFKPGSSVSISKRHSLLRRHHLVCLLHFAYSFGDS